MIWCDGCEYWFHCDCLGLDNAAVDILSKNNSDYLCYKCTGSSPPYGDLPRHPPLSQPSFMWGGIPGSTFSTCVTCAYDEVVHWRRNLFSVPVGRAGTQFVHELARLFQSFADGSALEGVALKAAMLLPILLLQKPHFKSRSREDARVLERRLSCWQVGDLDSLLRECRSIQQHLPSSTVSTAPSSGQMAHRFAKLMMEGKLRAASRLIEDNAECFPLALNSRVSLQVPSLLSGMSCWGNIQQVIHLSHLFWSPSLPSSFI